MNSGESRLTPAQATRRLTMAVEAAIKNRNHDNVLPAHGVINALTMLAEALAHQETVIADLQRALAAKP